MYEYKFIPTPQQVNLNGKLKSDRGGLAGTLDSEATFLSASGWEFMRFDRVPVTRRRMLVLKVADEEQVMVFRRPVNEAQPSNIPTAPAPMPEPQVRPHRLSRGRKRYIPERLMVPGPEA